MSGFWLGVLGNLIADILLIIVGLLVGGLIITLPRRKLNKFFGVSKHKRLEVYLSNIHVETFGSVGVDGNKYSYTGSTAPYLEMIAADAIENEFRFILKSVTESPNFIQSLFLSDVICRTSLSPNTLNDLEDQVPFITLGSPVYNQGSKFIENTFEKGAIFRAGILTKKELKNQIKPDAVSSSTDSFTTIMHRHREDDPDSVMPSGVARAQPDSGPYPWLDNRIRNNQELQKPSAITIVGIPPISSLDAAFVQRVYDAQKDRNLFYIAGLTEQSTAGAVHFLLSNWRALYKKYGEDAPFIVMLSIDENNYKRATIRFEKTIE